MLTIALALATLQPAVESMQVETNRDPIDDRVTAYATVLTPQGRLSIGCEPDRFRGVRVTFRARAWLADESVFTGNRRFVYRFDNGPVHRARWTTSRQSSVIRSRYDTAQFLQRMGQAQQLAIRAVDVEGRAIDLVFPLAGADRAIPEMMRLCNDVTLLRELGQAPRGPSLLRRILAWPGRPGD